MLGFFGIFGRSSELRELDQAVREAGLHPRLMPESVKLTTLRLLKQTKTRAAIEPRAYAAAAELLVYCMLGAQGFAEANGLPLTEAVEARIKAAVREGDSLDAQLVLLTLHAGVIQSDVVERYRLEVG